MAKKGPRVENKEDAAMEHLFPMMPFYVVNSKCRHYRALSVFLTDLLQILLSLNKDFKSSTGTFFHFFLFLALQHLRYTTKNSSF